MAGGGGPTARDDGSATIGGGPTTGGGGLTRWSSDNNSRPMVVVVNKRVILSFHFVEKHSLPMGFSHSHGGDGNKNGTIFIFENATYPRIFFKPLPIMGILHSHGDIPDNPAGGWLKNHKGPEAFLM